MLVLSLTALSHKDGQDSLHRDTIDQDPDRGQLTNFIGDGNCHVKRTYEKDLLVLNRPSRLYA
jgi:hypothetical protein